MDGGRRLWRTTSTGACQDMGAAGGNALLVRQECWNDAAPLDSTDAVTSKARKLDGPGKGQPKWVYLAFGIESMAIR
ncbi:hypothetical protein [Streptomyces griseorubiginosus]|uniref:hypothetical protein n=1 Tax=Streptomyces griseorubiginosus TaxID=67304 RepID=UPI001AD6A237|nr:hypothetical protein [Streptomyces griseorubiginosus]MBO4259025.1 hypothetical protein [Streptomyces griseorubiginosus]